MDNGRSAAYTYDSLYRLTSAITTGSTAYPKWGLSETYDRYGNRTAQSTITGQGCTGVTCPTNSVSVNASNNRINTSGYTYDAGGNMTNDGVNTIVYDGENRATGSSNGSASGVYTYDGNGLRVQKVSGATTTVTIFSGGLDIAEYFNGAAPSAPGNEFIYVGSQRILLIQSGTNYYLHNDHLSLRVRTNSSGNIVDQRGHFPFGETWYSPSGAPLIFTSYYRDTESGNDYALARTYVNRLGRFSSPDPIAGDVGDPQSLNRYAYVRNSPTSSTDTTGLSPNNVHISAAYLMPGAGGDCVLDGVSIGCEDLMGGSGGAFAKCPKNNCDGLVLHSLGPHGDRFDSDPLGIDALCSGFNCTLSYRSIPVDNTDLYVTQALWDQVYGHTGGGNSGGNIRNGGKSSGDNGWGTFAKTFFTVPYRKPGETFTACWNRAASDTLVGMGVPREATPGTEALLGSAGTVGLFSSVKSIWALGNWVRPSSYLAKTLGAGSAGVRAARLSGQAMAASLAAEAGLRAGAALDCAIPVN